MRRHYLNVLLFWRLSINWWINKLKVNTTWIQESSIDSSEVLVVQSKRQYNRVRNSPFRCKCTAETSFRHFGTTRRYNTRQVLSKNPEWTGIIEKITRCIQHCLVLDPLSLFTETQQYNPLAVGNRNLRILQLQVRKVIRSFLPEASRNLSSLPL